MKLTLCFLLLLPLWATAQDSRLSVTGLKRTPLDYVWKLKAREHGWSGQLDCQSFFHSLMVNDGKKDILLYLDAAECAEWRDRFEKATILLPVCLKASVTTGIQQLNCK